MARSLALAVARASCRFARLAQAMSRTDPARPMSSQMIIRPVLSMVAWCSPMTLKPRPALSFG